jgi:hypothetical protein
MCHVNAPKRTASPALWSGKGSLLGESAYMNDLCLDRSLGKGGGKRTLAAACSTPGQHCSAFVDSERKMVMGRPC